MKIMKSILIALFLFISTSVMALDLAPLTETYVYRVGKWYFEDNFGRLSKEVIGIDIETFEVINCSFHWGESCFFAKDKNYVYFKGKRIVGANPHTFRVIHTNTPYSKDDKNVYFEIKKIANADPATFELVDEFREQRRHRQHLWPYAKDKNSVFRNGVAMPYDVSTFRVLGRGFYKVDIYRTDFTTADFFFTADKRGIYYNDKFLEGTSFEDFRFLPPKRFDISYTVYLISNNRVYFRGEEIKVADAESFRILTILAGQNYFDATIARDRNYIYINGQVFTKIDVATFRVVNRNEVKETWGGVGTIRSTGDTIIADKNGTYRIEERRDGTFAIIPIEVE